MRRAALFGLLLVTPAAAQGPEGPPQPPQIQQDKIYFIRNLLDEANFRLVQQLEATAAFKKNLDECQAKQADKHDEAPP